MDKLKSVIIEKINETPLKIGSLMINQFEKRYSIIKYDIELKTAHINKIPVNLYLAGIKKPDIGDFVYNITSNEFILVDENNINNLKIDPLQLILVLLATTDESFVNIPRIPTSFLEYLTKCKEIPNDVDVKMKPISPCTCDSIEKLYKCPHSLSGDECSKRFPNGDFWKDVPVVDENNCVQISKEKKSLTIDEVQDMLDIVCEMISDKHNYSKDEINEFHVELTEFLQSEINLLK